MAYYSLFPQTRQTKGPGGPPLSLNEAMKKHEKLIHAFIYRQGGGSLSYDEALQAGRIGLWRAIRGYDGGRGFAFSTYAWVAIRRAIQKAAKQAEQPATQRVECLAEQAYRLDMEAGMDQLFIQHSLDDLVARLPARLRRVIEGRYGLADGTCRSLAELGQELGVTGERIRQLQQDALAWLRHPAHSVHLRCLMGLNTVRDYRLALRQNAAWQRKRSGRQ